MLIIAGISKEKPGFYFNFQKINNILIFSLTEPVVFINILLNKR